MGMERPRRTEQKQRRTLPKGSARERVALLRAQRRRRWRWLWVTGGIVLLLLPALAGAGWLWQTVAGMRQPDLRPAGTVVTTNAVFRQPFTVLLLGVDRRPDGSEGVRSDTLILAYVHPTERWASLLSIPRDTVATIPGLGEQKINVAYGYGYQHATELYGAGADPAAAGAALTAETVAQFLNLPVDYVAQIDFTGFERFIDTLGGVVIDVPYPVLDSSFPTADYGYERIFIPAGLQVINGETALKYARSRHGSSDFERTRRQQMLLRAVLETVRARGVFEQASLLTALIDEARRSVKTTLPIDDPAALRELMTLAQMIDSQRIATFSINPREVAIVAEIGSDIYWNRRDVAAMVERLRAGPRIDAEQARIQVLNGTPVNGLAARISRALANANFQTLPAANTDRQETTILIDYTGKPATLARLAGHLGLPASQVFASPPDDAPPQPLGADIVLLIGQDYDPAWAMAP